MAATNGTPDSNGYLASDLINLALRQIGIGAMGTTASDADILDGVMHLNMMLAQWQRRRWMVPNLTDLFCISTGKSTYNVGPGQDFDIDVRPDKIEAAYARLLVNGATASVVGEFSGGDFSSDFQIGSNGLDSGGQPIDYPLHIISSYEDYAAIGLKGLRTWPSYAFYNPSYPYGQLMPWPIPQAGIWELHIIVKQPLQASVKASDPINLPPEYQDAIMWSLAARMAPSYGQEVSPTVASMARAALNTIRVSNVQIPALSMPAALNQSTPFYWPGLETRKL